MELLILSLLQPEGDGMRKLAMAMYVATLLLTASGCSGIDWPGTGRMLASRAEPGRNLFYFDRVQDNAFDTVKIYVDNRGAIYPSTGLPRTFVLSENPKIIPFSLRTLMLKEDNGKPSRLCETVEQMSNGSPNEATGLCIAANDTTSPIGDFKAELGCLPEDAHLHWVKSQADLWENAARGIARRATADGTPRTIVMLIHGFNVSQGDSDFNAVKSEILRVSKDKNLLFVEIHWDGGMNTSSWNLAQYSGQIVGINLRQLVNGIQRATQPGREPPMRIITHSSGAFILGALLGDSRGPNDKFHEPANSGRSRVPELETPENLLARCFYTRAQSGAANVADRFSVPHFSNIRALMFAAATPSSTFTKNRTGGREFDGLLAANVKLLVAVNARDEALNKMGWGPFAPFTSDTPLGTLKSDYCRLLQRTVLHKSALGIESFGFKFTRKDDLRWPTEFEQETHSWPLYAAQAMARETPLFDLLLNANDDQLRTIPSSYPDAVSYISPERCAKS